MGPAYSAAVVAVCDDGGLYAVANIRGGAEEGEAWHRAGMREQQAADLRRLRRRRRLARRRPGHDVARPPGHPRRQQRRPAHGRRRSPSGPTSAGPRRSRCRCSTWCATTGSSSPGCGSPSTATPTTPTSSTGCHAYSPYHRVVDGTCYPAVLLTTAEDDSPGRPDARPQDGRPAAGGHVVRRRPARSCCARRPAPATARASRCRSRPTSSPTSSASSAGSSVSTVSAEPPGLARERYSV